MKRFTSLMLMLLCAVATSWAFGPGETITDMSTLSDGDYVFIKNVGRGKYAYENPGNRWIGNGDEATDLTYAWQVHVEEGGKYSFSSVMGYYIPTPLDGSAMYTVEATDETKDEFTFTAHPEDNTKWLVHSTNDNNIYWDGQVAQFVGWRGNGANSRFEIIAVDVTTDEINEYINSYYSTFVNNARNAAIAEVELLATEPVIFPAATETVAGINAVPFTGTTEAEANEAIAAINALVVAYKTNAYKALNGKYFTLYTPGRSAYAKMTANGTGNAGTASTPDFVWQFVENNGSVNIYNPYIGKYLVMNSTNAMNVTENAAEAGAFNIIVVSAPSVADAKVSFQSGDLNIHLNGSLLGWYSGGASEWTVAELTDFESMISSYKTAVFANADALAFACNNEQIEAVKAAVNDVETTGFAAFSEINDAYTNVVAGLGIENKYFTFRATSTDEKRNLVWAAASAAGTAIGADEYSDNAVWQTIPAGIDGFYLKNARQGGYIGLPGGNQDVCRLTAEPTYAYTFELIDKESKIFELHTNGRTLHASNHDDDKLLNWDGNEAASRWTVLETEAVVALEKITKEWKGTDDWGLAIPVADYPATAVNEGAGSNPVKVREFEITTDGAKVMDITFAYTTGTCALNVLGVEVVDAGGHVVAGDYKSGKTGTGTTCSYQVKVAEAGAYTLRYYVWSDAANRLVDTNGTITIVIDGVETTDFSHQVTFAAEYATLYLGYKVAIPTGVEAYVVSSVDQSATLSPVTDVIPANTAVLLKNTVATETEYTFEYTNENADAVETNYLDGSIVDRYVADNAYVLANGEVGIGFYIATKNQLENAAFKNNANKAYLPKTAGMNAASYSFRFGEGTTGVENVVVENEVKAIYDLTGRRVEAITAPGIYVVNGKKFLVK